MASSIQDIEEKIEIVFDVTKQAKYFLNATEEGKAGCLMRNDIKKDNESLGSYFSRGATHIVNGEAFDGKRYVAEGEKQFEAKYLKQFSAMNSKFVNIAQYEMQNFISILTAMLNIALGRNPADYNPKFLNGRICHFWKEKIGKEDYLCLLSVNDGLSIALDAGEKEVYIPGAMMLEVKVPCSVIENKEPISVKHITRALVSSKELRDLLYANPALLSLYMPDPENKSLAIKLKESLDALLKNTKKTFPENLDKRLEMIKAPNFKDKLYKNRIGLYYREFFFTLDKSKQNGPQQECEQVQVDGSQYKRGQ